jgi:hypothetical protein
MTADALGAAEHCPTCGSEIRGTPWGPIGMGVCRDPRNPNWDDEGQHIGPLDNESVLPYDELRGLMS